MPVGSHAGGGRLSGACQPVGSRLAAPADTPLSRARLWSTALAETSPRRACSLPNPGPRRGRIRCGGGRMTEFVDDSAQLEHAADLRRASDLFMQRLDRLQELETRKRELPP